MTAKTRANFKSGQAASFADNTSGAITAAFLRAEMVNIADSAAFPEDLGNLATSPTRTAESFGAVAVAHGAAPVDNLAALQAAIDWSAANGGIVVLGHGRYGFSGTLDFKANAGFIGQGEHQTTLIQMNTAWPNCLVPSHVDGNGMNTLMNLTIDGGWDKKAVFGVGANWDYAAASMTQIGVQMSCPSTGPTQTRVPFSDMQSRIINVAIRNVAGIGLSLAGRGEVQVIGLMVSTTAGDGIVVAAADNFFQSVSVFTTGNRGMLISDGNQRLLDVKCWFNGMRLQEAADAAFEISGPVTANVIAAGLSIQDSWGYGMTIDGVSHKIQANIAEVGNLKADPSYGFGFATQPATLAYMRINGSNDCVFDVTMRNRKNVTATITPHLVYFDDSGSRRNVIRITPDRQSLSSGAVIFYNTATPVQMSSGYSNAKRYDEVWLEPTHALIHRKLTAANFADAAHDINFLARPGARALRDDNVWMEYDGAAWVATVRQPDLAAKANVAHTHVATDISNSTAAGRAMLTAADGAAQTALLNLFTTALKGLVPASGGGTTNFLRADGTWAAPPGGGGSDAHDTQIAVRNATGGTLAKLTPLALGSDSATTTPNVIAALGASAMPCIGIAIADITDGTTGQAMREGLITGIDTSGYTFGDPLYVAAAGGLTKTKPTSGFIQIVAYVTRVHASTGEIFVALGQVGQLISELTLATSVSGTERFPISGDQALTTGQVITEARKVDYIAETTTARTLGSTDNGKVIGATNASATVFTIPANSTVALPVGFTAHFTRDTDAVVTIDAETGVGLNGASGGSTTITTKYRGVVTVHQVATDVWIARGDCAAVA